MSKKKILIVFGTRPEAIKMAPLIKILKEEIESFHVKVCVTGQHRQMLDQVLDVFNIVPDYDLNLMQTGQDLFDITSRVLLDMRRVLEDFLPNLVLVHGDTTTCFAASIAAFYMKIDIGHIEAGLRTYDFTSPWPEEMNRQLTDRLCTYHFAPTKESKINLINELIEDRNIFVTGNTVIDALFMAISLFENNKDLENQITNKFIENGLRIFDEKPVKEYILVTGHRRENFGNGFLNICEALKQIAISFPQVQIVYPVHLNPNVQEPVYQLLSGLHNVHLIAPVDYLPFVYLMKHCKIILTDSGGVQEEAPSLGKPVLVMRETTERPEAVKAGTVILVGTDPDSIVSNVELLLNNSLRYQEMSKTMNPYGDGLASLRIRDILKLKVKI